MKKAKGFRIVYTTIDDAEIASFIAKVLIEEKLAACVNISSNSLSVYNWNDSIEETKEIVLMIKTHKSKLSRLEETILKYHSYEVPEIVVVKMYSALDSYLSWITREIL